MTRAGRLLRSALGALRAVPPLPIPLVPILRLAATLAAVTLAASPLSAAALPDSGADGPLELSILEHDPRAGLARVLLPRSGSVGAAGDRGFGLDQPVQPGRPRRDAQVAVFAGFRPLGWTRVRPSGLARLPWPSVPRGERLAADPPPPPLPQPPPYLAAADLEPAPDALAPGVAAAERPAVEVAPRSPVYEAPDLPLTAWVLPDQFIAALRAGWPLRGPLYARIEALAPGLQGAWLSAGRRAGVQVGDAWWLRIAGQPIARFDVCLVEDELCYAAMVPLVANPQINRGDRVAAWPAPGQQRHSGARSAVSHVEGSGARLRIWIAAPPQAIVPPEPQVEFYRGGRFIALGLVDQQDERFWHARLITDPAGLRRPDRPGGEADAVEPDLPRVGDDVLIRTLRDSEQRDFAARVFEAVRDGFLINAGDGDGLEYGQTGSAWRGGRRLGQVTVRRVQRVYAQVEPDEQAVAAGFGLGDEVRFGPPPPLALPAGVITEVADETLFAATLPQGVHPPLRTPLAIRSEGLTIGVAVLLAAEEDQAIGVALAESLTRPLVRGQELLFELVGDAAAKR